MAWPSLSRFLLSALPLGAKRLPSYGLFRAVLLCFNLEMFCDCGFWFKSNPTTANIFLCSMSMFSPRCSMALPSLSWFFGLNSKKITAYQKIKLFMKSKQIAFLIGLVLLNFSIQSLNPIDFSFENYYELTKLNISLIGLIANKLIRLSINLIGLATMIPREYWQRINIVLLMAILLTMALLYFCSFFQIIPAEISKFLNPILFSPLLVIISSAFKISMLKNKLP
jgi:hypothetical protein